MSVEVNGQSETVPVGATLGGVLAQIGLKPKPGRLLDVQGGVLETNAYPARMHVNGKRATRRTKLESGDVVEVVPGKDHTEETSQKRDRLNEGQPTNPQFHLGTAPGFEVTTPGKESGKIEAVVFDPSGPIQSPRAVALTFDDGPSPTYTPKVLRILRRFHVQATFFVVGNLAQNYPDLVAKELAQGHVVGSHSWNHPHDFASLDPEQQVKQIQQSVDAIEAAGGEPYLFRPPEGSFDAGVVEAARRAGMRTVIWSISVGDYLQSQTRRDITHGVLRRVKPGSIILLHDGGGDQSATVKALPDIIKGIRKRHLDIVVIPRNG